MITLYNNAYSTCSQKVRLCLAEKNIPFEDVQISFVKSEHLTPEYLKINPNGVLPSLVHDGKPILDSSVIMEYLDEVFPDTAMIPTDAVSRAAMRAWLRFFEEVPTVAVRYPSFNQAFVQRFADHSDDAFREAADRRPLRKHFFEQMGRQGFDDAQIKASLERLRTTVERMDRALASGGPWLLGAQLTIADACIAPLIDRMNDLGLSWLWDRAPHVADWFARWRARPSYKATFYFGARLTDIDPTVRDRAPAASLLESA